MSSLWRVRSFIAKCVFAGLCIATGGVDRTIGQSLLQATPDVVHRLLDSGRYDEADRAATELTAAVLRQNGTESLEYARALQLLVPALLANGKAGADSTVEVANRAADLAKRHLGAEHLETARSLDQLGAVRVERGEAVLALSLHEQALAIRRHHLSSSDRAIADSEEGRALALIGLERFDQAREALAHAQQIRESHSADEPLRLAHVFMLQAWLSRYSGRYASSMPLLDRAFEIWKSAAPEHPDIVSATEVRGDLLWLQGDVGDAQAAWSSALELAERTLRPGHPTLPPIERRLATAAAASGNRADARRWLEQGLMLAEASMAPCNPELPALLADLGTSLWYGGEYAQAQKITQRAYETYERCLGPRHSYTATVLFNQAGLAYRIGDFAEAERLYNRVINLWTATFGPKHPFVARGLGELAQVANSKGQHVRAMTLLEKALAIRLASNRPNHPDTAWTLTSLARVCLESGRLAAAEEYAERAQRIYQTTETSDQADHFGRFLVLRAEIDERRGRYEEARALLEQALDSRASIFGLSHPRTAWTRKEIALAEFALGRPASALDGALEAERDGRAQLRFTVRYLPERQGLTYADSRPKGLDLALSIVAANRSDGGVRVFDSVIKSRSVILDELGARSRLASRPDPQMGALNASLTAARQRYANLMFASLTNESFARKPLDEARQQKENAERALAERSGAAATELTSASAGLEEVRRALPAEAALVAYARYDRVTFAADDRGVVTERTSPAYLAFVIRAGDTEVHAFPLGNASTIDGLVARWRTQTMAIVQASSPAAAERTYRAAGSALRQRIWDPLREALKDSKTVFVVPDGTLNLTSLAALPIGQRQYFIESGPVVHYLSAERDLLSAPSDSTSRGLLAVGGAAFDDASSFARAPKRAQAPLSPSSASRATAVVNLRSTRSERLGVACGSFPTLQFQPLDGTRREVHEVASLWTDSPVRILEGREADERTFKREAPGHRVLHLSTHGFFLGGPCPSVPGTRSIGGLATSRPARSSVRVGDSPLLLSGLALAGANRRALAGPDYDDGILTAEEVASLNLEGVEWAVLSACDTGLGQVKAGEGVFGLRRAFQVAGVRTVIMSLWSVDDQAARRWMRALYEGRLQKHLNTADAMHDATLTVLRERRARGQSTHPFYWAAFVAAGDWR